MNLSVSSVDFANTLPCTSKCITWPQLTYSTSQHLRISVTFQVFNFEDPNEYVQIGDGNIIQEETRLAHMTGTYPPSDISSISNAMWIRIRVPCGNQIPDIRMTVTAVDKSGTYTLAIWCVPMKQDFLWRAHDYCVLKCYRFTRLIRIRIRKLMYF